jgi:hypothetical protein
LSKSLISPKISSLIMLPLLKNRVNFGDKDGARTHSLQIRSLLHYPIMLPRQ